MYSNFNRNPEIFFPKHDRERNPNLPSYHNKKQRAPGR